MRTIDDLVKTGDPVDPDLVSFLAAEGLDTIEGESPSARPAPGVARWLATKH